MDFQSLTRRELQALCKKNKIPANITNVAMADALEALQKVEGLEELLNASESQNSQSPEKLEIGSPEIPRTVCRTSTRRRPIKAAEEPESSQTLTRTRRGTRRITEEVNREKSEAVQTPAVPSSRKRAPAASAHQKTTKPEQRSVQRLYSTRRSARLPEKLGRTPMEVEFSKVMTKDLDGVEEENKASELQAILEDSSKITNDSEIVSDQKPVQIEHDSKAEAEEITEEFSKPNHSDFIEVLEVKDEEAVDEQNTEAEMQKTEGECEEMDESNALLSESPKNSVHLNDESIVEKGIDVSSVTMWKIENLNDENVEMENEQQGMGSDNIENLNEDTEMENEQQEQGMGSDQAPQAFVDDSSLKNQAFADEVLCENPVSLDNEMTEFEEFDMSLNQKATGLEMEALDSSCDSEKAELSLRSAWMHSTGSDSSVIVVVDQSEAAQVELEYANQGSIDFETDKPNSEENATPVDEFLPFLDSSFPTPVKLMMSPHTAISGRSPLSPPAAQAALPTLSTPTRKSSSSKNNPPSAVAQKKTIISDNKENLDNNGWKKIEIKNSRGGGDTTEEDIKNLNNTSLRQLRKMFKVLQIKEKANKNSEDNNTNDVKEEVGVAKMRPALQTLPENCMPGQGWNCDRNDP